MKVMKDKLSRLKELEVMTHDKDFEKEDSGYDEEEEEELSR